ncbi:DUF421 domain-containing protein [Periweissella beninensis]|uniref:DUF421 domain-containing protein n=1 Tax=Periweissella beninensis TaxID=504936 RepID=A0ABT0VI65_9LACO|nr:DUF421 domain-containing protein [Periweissella beninensis]MBM7544827.1 uncharacterized membrane protein YcaP (DUF421 family) [Periweissella beninensis]MCM2437074.1 DUF421 domain-containing protein [Periweissella beninensis]MCT4396667.1 DUF421 domain-containing protein [Periweissella beninensis]
MPTYLDVFIKLAIGIIMLVIQINILGKGNLAPISALDQVQNYVLGGIIGGVIYNNTITVLNFAMVLVIWTFLVLLMKFLKEHSYWIKRFVDGQPLVVIKNGALEMNAIMKMGLPASELMFKLRAAGVDEIQTVKRAILEQNGQLTIIRYGDETVKYPLIQDGQINYQLLETLDKDVSWIEKEVLNQTGKKIDDIYLGEFIHGRLILHSFNAN